MIYSHFRESKTCYLLKFNSIDETPLEVVESVDMMRVIESGGRVKMVMTKEESYGVDTKEDLEMVAKKMEGDSLLLEYMDRD